MDDETKQKHRQRAIGALAEHICSTDLTDGFCGPDFLDGKISGRVVCRLPRRDCVRRAAGMMRAIESRGCSVVWDQDPAIEKQS